MLPGRGRAKGANFERRMAKRVGEWWGRKVSRTPLSGGWGNNTFFETAGDLVAQGGWPFVWELKCHEKWHLEQILANGTSGKSLIAKWWGQACREALGHKKRKMPLLVFTRNFQPEYLMLRKVDFEQMTPTWRPLGAMFEVYMECTQDVVLIMLLDDFLHNVAPPRPSPRTSALPMPISETHDVVVQRKPSFAGLKKRRK